MKYVKDEVEHLHFPFSVHAFVEATKYLLDHGVDFVLSHVFNQDPLEEHFGRHRGMGRRMDNPNLWTFGYAYQYDSTEFNAIFYG